MKMVARLKVEDEKKKGRTAPFWLGFEGSVGGKKKFQTGGRGAAAGWRKKIKVGGGRLFFFREGEEGV